MIDATNPDAPPRRCVLQDRRFAAMGEIAFRRLETDRDPVMTLRLGDRDAVVALRAIQREWQIPDDSEDGRMLALIGEALDFVACLRPGDALPDEVLTGQASWTPDPEHHGVARARLHLQLVAWLSHSANVAPGLGSAELLRLADQGAVRAQVSTALSRVAQELKLPDAGAVAPMLEELARELAYVEALRDRLLRRVERLAGAVAEMSRVRSNDAKRHETLVQVQRLSALALRQFRARFQELDAQTGEVLSALRNAGSQRAFIRSNRDWLYRSQRAWEPLLNEWAKEPQALDEAAWALLGRTYQFLAPRFMVQTKWQLTTRPTRPRDDASPSMMW